jgi:hypothetical protein
VEVDLPSAEGSLGARRGEGRASGRKGPRGAFKEGIYLSWGPSGEIGGAAAASSITSDFAERRTGNVGI